MVHIKVTCKGYLLVNMPTFEMSISYRNLGFRELMYLTRWKDYVE